MRISIFGVLDAIIDPIAQRMAKAMVENMEVAAQNRLARLLAEMSDDELDKKGISREKLIQGSTAYPWSAAHSDTGLEELEAYLMRLAEVKWESFSGQHHMSHLLA